MFCRETEESHQNACSLKHWVHYLSGGLSYAVANLSDLPLHSEGEWRRMEEET